MRRELLGRRRGSCTSSDVDKNNSTLTAANRNWIPPLGSQLRRPIRFSAICTARRASCGSPLDPCSQESGRRPV